MRARWQTQSLRSLVQGSKITLYFLGTLAYSQGHTLQAGELYDESVRMHRAEAGTEGLVAGTLIHLAMVALDQGDDVRAGTYLAESITLLREQDDRWTSLLALEVSARWVAQPGRRTADGQALTLRAARLFGAAEALRETLGAPRLAIYEEHYQRSVASLRSQLDERAWAAAWAEGRAMTLEQALTEALDLLGDSAAEAAAPDAAGQEDRSPRPRPATRLTAREVAVLTVVADGATDQEVAERLGLPPRTVTSYLTRIYAKLGVRTRTAAVRVAREHNHV